MSCARGDVAYLIVSVGRSAESKMGKCLVVLALSRMVHASAYEELSNYW